MSGIMSRAVILTFIALGAITCQAARLVVFGDSWAQRPEYLRDVVLRNPDATHVWLTIGGNDANFELPFGVPVDVVLEEVRNRTATFLAPLFKAHPTIRVVQFGYDLLTFSKGILCPILGELVLPKCKSDPVCINGNFTRIQTDYVDKMKALFPRHDSVNLLGTLQVAGNITGAAVGKPVLSKYSPDHLLQDDCIHANDEGFLHIFRQLWKMYFAKFDQQTPTNQ